MNYHANHATRTFSICFRIVRDATHWQRRNRLFQAVAAESIGKFWSRTTSTIILRSKRPAQDLLTTLAFKAELDDSDRLLVIDVTDQASARFGLDQEDVLDLLLPVKLHGAPMHHGDVSQA